jgi:hypothetical protein
MSTQDYVKRLQTGRNDLCLCGSGKKYKKCHLAQDERAEQEALKITEGSGVIAQDADQDSHAAQSSHHANRAVPKMRKNTAAPRFNVPRRTAG